MGNILRQFPDTGPGVGVFFDASSWLYMTLAAYIAVSWTVRLSGNRTRPPSIGCNKRCRILQPDRPKLRTAFIQLNIVRILRSTFLWS